MEKYYLQSYHRDESAKVTETENKREHASLSRKINYYRGKGFIDLCVNFAQTFGVFEFLLF